MFFTKNKNEDWLAAKILNIQWLTFLLCMVVLLSAGAVYCQNYYPVIEFEIAGLNSEDIICVFYDNGSNGFDEDHLIQSEATDKDAYVIKYSIQIPMVDLLRVDFAAGRGNLEIQNMVIKTLFMDKNITAQFMETCSFSEYISNVDLCDDTLMIAYNGADPHMVLDHLDTVDNQLSFSRAGLVVFYCAFVVCISGLLSLNIIRIRNLFENMSISKRYALIICIILFFSVRIFFLCHFSGYFSFDEFYHIATVNPDYATDYDRALFLNFMVETVCAFFGIGNVSVKLIPFLLGTVSFFCTLHLLYHLYEHSFWIIAISSIYTFMPYIQLNHFYIRMYVFLEAVVLILCVMVYHAERLRNSKKGTLYMVAADLIVLWYVMSVKDFSSKALILLAVVVNSYYFFRDWIKKKLVKYTVGRAIAVFLFIFSGVIYVYFIAVKEHWIKNDFMFEKICSVIGMDFDTFYHSEELVFPEFLFIRVFFVICPFFISLWYCWKENKIQMKTLYIVAGLPMLGYLMIFYNANLIRSYIAYFPIVCILAFQIFDKIGISVYARILFVGIISVWTLQVPDGFWSVPNIPYEIYFKNYGEAVKFAKDLECQGYEIVPMMTYETQSAYFDLLDANTNLNTKDVPLNEKTDVDFIMNNLNQIIRSDKRTVIIAEGEGVYLLRNAQYKHREKDNCIIRKFDGEIMLAIVN